MTEKSSDSWTSSISAISPKTKGRGRPRALAQSCAHKDSAGKPFPGTCRTVSAFIWAQRPYNSSPSSLNVRATSAASTFPHFFLRGKDTCLFLASVSEVSASIGGCWHCCSKRSVAKCRSVFSDNPRNCTTAKEKFKQPNNDLHRKQHPSASTLWHSSSNQS